MEDMEKSADEIFNNLDAELAKDTPNNQQETTTPEKVEAEKPEQSKELQSALAQKEHYRAKYEELAKSKPQVVGQSPMDIVKLAKALDGKSEDEIDFITRNARSSKVDDIIAASKDEWVNDAINARRKKEQDKKKVPGSSSPDFASGGKSWKDIKKMSRDDFQKFEEEQTRGSSGI